MLQALTCDAHLTVSLCQYVKDNQNVFYKLHTNEDLACPVSSIPVSLSSEGRVGSMQFS